MIAKNRTALAEEEILTLTDTITMEPLRPEKLDSFHGSRCGYQCTGTYGTEKGEKHLHDYRLQLQ